MKNLLFTAAIVIGCCFANLTASAQTKIGGAPGPADASAYLQLGDPTSTASTSKGLLLSRVNLTATNVWGLAGTVTKPAGMVVYNTNPGIAGPNAQGVGLYYWDGTVWVRLQSTTPNIFVYPPNSSSTGSPTTLGVACDPSTNKNTIYTDTIPTLSGGGANPTYGKQWICDGTGWITYTAPNGTEWYIDGTTNDAGADKASAIQRDGNVTVGNPTTGGGVITINKQIGSNTFEGGELRLKPAIAGDPYWVYDVTGNGAGNAFSNVKGRFHIVGTSGAGPVLTLMSGGNVCVGCQQTENATDLLTVGTTSGGNYHGRLRINQQNTTGIEGGEILLAGATTGEGDFIIDVNGAGTGNGVSHSRLRISNTAFGPPLLHIMSGGNVGIGTAAPSERLAVLGNILASGTITPSDVRYKQNIATIPNALSLVEQMNGASYNFRTQEFNDRGFDDRKHYGFIAQELEKVLPEVVKTQPDGYKAVNYMEVIPVLTNAIKEQQAQIEALKKEVELLKQK